MKRFNCVLLLMLLGGCAGGHHHKDQVAEDRKRDETEQERAARLRREAEIKKKQAADAEKFAKDLALISTVMPGDPYQEFYQKANDARLTLEHVARIEDGTVERYAFMDNSTAFVTVTVKGDRVREIAFEGLPDR